MGRETPTLDASSCVRYRMIDKDKQIAIVAGDRLGDGLILLLMAYNFYLKGYEVTFFNSPLLSLQDWFPWANIKSHFPQQETSKHLQSFDVLIFQHHNRHAREEMGPHQRRFILYKDSLFMKKRSLVDIYFDACSLVFNLKDCLRTNGIIIPPNLSYRKYSKRIIIHPMSLRPEKNWPKDKFFKLGKRFIELGYEPVFMVSPNEEEEWKFIQSIGLELKIFPNLSDVASYIYESAYLVGNDSGLAHLASSIQIPTIPLFIRPGVAKRWRPNFSPSFPVLPWLHLPGPKLQERFWKSIITVNAVLRVFKKAQRKMATKFQA